MKTKSLPIPEGVLAQHIGILGKTGSGKSSKARVLVEYMLTHDMPVCIIDPKGDWWGLKLSADGQAAGFPLVIFGGDHADVPINEKAGKAVAEIVATGNRSCIIDLGGWTVGERTRFFIDFASTLFKLTKGSRHVLIDEVHNFAPKGKVFDADAGIMLHWANRLASEGRGRGLKLIAASQRPQKVHNDLLTSCETLIACRVIHKADRDAITEWIKGSGDMTVGAQVLETLASMSRPEAWVWSPEINFGPNLVKFPLFKTYDSFKPQDHDAAPLTGWAAVDLEEVKTRLASIVEEVEASNPNRLKEKLAQLAKDKATADREIKRLQSVVHGLQDKLDAALIKSIDNRQPEPAVVDQAAISALHKILQLTTKALGQECTVDNMGVNGSKILSPPAEKQKPQQISVLKTERTNSTGSSLNSSTELTGPEQKVIDAIAWYEAAKVPSPYTRVQLAFVAGYSPTSGGFKNILGKLKGAGLIDYPTQGYIEITDLGWKYTTPINPPKGTAELHDFIKAQLTGPQWKVLQEALQAYPDSISKTAIAEGAGYEWTSGGFKNLLGQLRGYGLIDYPKPGQVKAEDILFIH